MTERLIIDSDAGWDPDDTLAILAASKLDVLAFVSNDETPEGERARYIQAIINSSDHDKPPVYTGFESPNPGKHMLGQFALELEGINQPPPIDEFFANMLLEESKIRPIRWVGIGPYTNLAKLYEMQPELAETMPVTLMGGRLNPEPTDRRSHNFKIDPEAALSITKKARDLTFVPTTVTSSPEILIKDLDHELLKPLTEQQRYRLVIKNFAKWFEIRKHGSFQHDLLTLAVATNSIRYEANLRVSVTREGGLIEDTTQDRVSAVTEANYPQMLAWAKSQMSQ